MNDVVLCRRLVARADTMRQQDPARSLTLARAARALASSLDRRRYDRGAWRALQSEAWAALSGAHRALGHGDHAEATLNIALVFLDADVREHDPTLPARLAQRAAYLRTAQGRFTEALELIDEAIANFEAMGKAKLLATALVDRAVILGDTGRKRLAVQTLRQALGRHGRDMDRRTFLAAVHNTAVFLYEVAQKSDETREALGWLRLALRCHAEQPATVERLKLRALLGLSALRLGLLDEGIAELWTAHDAFKRLGFAHQQALTLLDLARAGLTHDRSGELRRVAGEMFALLHAFSPSTAHRSALLSFCRAIQLGALTPSIVARTAEVMRTADS